MGITVLDIPVAQSIRTENVSRNRFPIAVGDDCIYILKYLYNPRVIKIDLSSQTTTVSNNFATEFGYTNGVLIYPFDIGRNRNGDLYLDCLVIDAGETDGARNLYLRRFTVDPTDLTLGAGTQRTLTGSADLGSLLDWWRFARFGETIICTCRRASGDDDHALKVDLHGQRYHRIEIDTTGSDWNAKHRWLCSIMVDRTTNTLYWLTKVYYWLTGSYAVMEIIDFANLTTVATYTGYDSGCGDGTALRFYRDSTGKVRYYHVGNTGAVTYTSHFGIFYVDNGSIVEEAERTINDTYKDYTGGNTSPIPVGITSTGLIAWLLIGGCWTDNGSPPSDYSEGFQLITTDDTFGSPTKVTSATYNITTADTISGDERRCLFLRENDWCYYAPNTIIASSPNDTWKWGKLDITDTGVTLTQDDPYGVIIVPKTGLIPTTLTLQITPL